ncbi:UDP-glucose--hexose-1-phosphate uridylyltransferase [Clostridium gasigenes]|uniref:UDP-glucose--hexose-1-phosphate uridylyltransferase n=1 Tax=Clostridium gasigenes TaxID=94869 RepID=UPI001626BD20|nr:UDP-glucose--hexose-1-phosphate uridylyltransferase [Clostridium gasigenes]MBB6624202.1 UDP-glucose--hexose-1-phosphate uridylyltransferase [Clostridium gasigenes]
MVNIFLEIDKLIKYSISKELIEKDDEIFTRNRILDFLSLESYECNGEVYDEKLNIILEEITKWAIDKNIIEEGSIVLNELFQSKIMACIVDRPSNIIKKFNEKYLMEPTKATEYFYNLSKYSNYIRTNDVKKDLKWKHNTSYGELDITINLSKPEKDPKAIIQSKNIKLSNYPSCLLCKENEGYAGSVNHPGRGHHRVIPLRLNSEKWFMQYSPYVYYNEHCIVFKGEHEPMKITGDTFKRLVDFVSDFPHYFIGSNADLPIVGGSILSHDHFQGGNYPFAMSNAKEEVEFDINRFTGVKACILSWPMSVVRIKSGNKKELVSCASFILEKFKLYEDKEIDVIAFTGKEPHNTITPICRKRDKLFELDLVLRNNRTTEEYPEGIFHPHKELHHIKRENIGLIEVMGLAVLPSRLKIEMEEIKEVLVGNKKLESIQPNDELFKHKVWIEELINKYGIINNDATEGILKKEIGNKFAEVLKDSGLFKNNEESKIRFIKYLN